VPAAAHATPARGEGRRPLAPRDARRQDEARAHDGGRARARGGLGARARGRATREPRAQALRRAHGARRGVRARARPRGTLPDEPPSHPDDRPPPPPPESERRREPDFFAELRANLVVDASERSVPPIVFEEVPTYSNLMGSLEAGDPLGPEHLRVRAGSLWRA